MASIASDTEGFNLVISDWERYGEPAQAGLELLQRLRRAHKTMPVVYYHGCFEPKHRAGRAEQPSAQARSGRPSCRPSCSDWS
jgi:hypothetical protein